MKKYCQRQPEPANYGIEGLVGEWVYTRAIAYTNTGRLVAITPEHYVLMEVSWIANTGRWQDFVKNGVADEVEPHPADKLVFVPRSNTEISMMDKPVKEKMYP
jgi:hypothetical protein